MVSLVVKGNFCETMPQLSISQNIMKLIVGLDMDTNILNIPGV